MTEPPTEPTLLTKHMCSAQLPCGACSRMQPARRIVMQIKQAKKTSSSLGKPSLHNLPFSFFCNSIMHSISYLLCLLLPQWMVYMIGKPHITSHKMSNQCKQQEVLTSEWVDLSKNQRFHLVYSYSTTRSHSTIHIHNLLLLISSLVIGHSTTWVHNTHLVPLSLLAVSILAAPPQVSDRVNRSWMCKKPATTCQLVSHCCLCHSQSQSLMWKWECHKSHVQYVTPHL